MCSRWVRERLHWWGGRLARRARVSTVRITGETPVPPPMKSGLPFCYDVRLHALLWPGVGSESRPTQEHTHDFID